MATLLEVIGPKSGPGPLTYTLAERGTVDLQSAFAHFDGAGAGAAFRPALTIRSQNGTILARVFPADTLAAGDTADVTYAPFLRASAAGGLSGLQFDTDPQAGEFLVATTTGEDGAGSNLGMILTATDHRIRVQAVGAGADAELYSLGGEVKVDAKEHVLIRTDGDINITADDPIDIKSGPTSPGNEARLVLSSGGNSILTSQAGQVGLEAGTYVYVGIGAAGAFIIFDSSFNELFRVDPDGALHGKTGQALTFDL